MGERNRYRAAAWITPFEYSFEGRKSRKVEAAQKKKAQPLTRGELTLLLRVCLIEYPVSYPFVLLLARTGLRIGEAVALQWGDFDFQHRFMAVERNWVDGNLTTPKSGLGRRVDTSRQLTDTLSALRRERKQETLKKGWGEVPPWIFTNSQGNHIDPDNFRNRFWPKLLGKAGLRRVRIHDLRHTFASALIQNGEVRHLPLNDRVKKISRSLPSRMKSAYVFPSRTNQTPLNANNFANRVWAPAVRRAKIEDLHWHDLRHTFASRLVMAGVDLRTVQELMGHKDIKMTLRYAHLSPRHTLAAVQRLNASPTAISLDEATA